MNFLNANAPVKDVKDPKKFFTTDNKTSLVDRCNIYAKVREFVKNNYTEEEKSVKEIKKEKFYKKDKQEDTPKTISDEILKLFEEQNFTKIYNVINVNISQNLFGKLNLLKLCEQNAELENTVSFLYKIWENNGNLAEQFSIIKPLCVYLKQFDRNNIWPANMQSEEIKMQIYSIIFAASLMLMSLNILIRKQIDYNEILHFLGETITNPEKLYTNYPRMCKNKEKNTCLHYKNEEIGLAIAILLKLNLPGMLIKILCENPNENFKFWLALLIFNQEILNLQEEVKIKELLNFIEDKIRKLCLLQISDISFKQNHILSIGNMLLNPYLSLYISQISISNLCEYANSLVYELKPKILQMLKTPFKWPNSEIQACEFMTIFEQNFNEFSLNLVHKLFSSKNKARIFNNLIQEISLILLGLVKNHCISFDFNNLEFIKFDLEISENIKENAKNIFNKFIEIIWHLTLLSKMLKYKEILKNGPLINNLKLAIILLEASIFGEEYTRLARILFKSIKLKEINTEDNENLIEELSNILAKINEKSIRNEILLYIKAVFFHE